MKTKTQYVCQSCGFSSPKWLGRCNACGEWNSMVEEIKYDSPHHSPSNKDPTLPSASKWEILGEENQNLQNSTLVKRLKTGNSELDRVLGGGVVPGSFILIGGDPGIGKSTLLLQVAYGMATQNIKIFYASGEESTPQLRIRAERLIGSQGDSQKINLKNIFIESETVLEKVFASFQEIQPQVVIIDSLQTFSSIQLGSPPGSVSQVREIASRLMNLAKEKQIIVWLVGHVTKEGSIAGPKMVEHMVDAVLYFEGDEHQNYRLLRTVKNRFGSTRELGVFEMSSEGLKEVLNPSLLFLSDRKEAVSGSAVTSSIEGSRSFLVELQALVSRSQLAIPRRTAVGLDFNRVSLLSAIMERHMDLSLAQVDLFFNVAGGFTLQETAGDLAAVAAIWSSYTSQSLPADFIFIGEVGLTGEVRPIRQLEQRLEEAKKLGFKGALIPEASQKTISENFLNNSQNNFKIFFVSKVSELAQILSRIS